jgi:hypothetical protein
MIQPRITGINPWEVLRYLGVSNGEAPEDLLETVRRCGEEIQRVARPRVVWRLFPLEGTTPAGTSLTLTGEDIRRHLHDCHQCVLMAATLGADVERLLMHTQVSDMAKALILDSCASSAVENLCDNFEADLRLQVEAEGLFLTDRFSPGYGDLPLALQREFCTLLNTQRQIGLTVSPTSLLIPRKSVTAVLGVSPTPRTTRSSGCQNCKMFATCTIRKSGAACQAPHTS